EITPRRAAPSSRRCRWSVSRTPLSQDFAISHPPAPDTPGRVFGPGEAAGAPHPSFQWRDVAGGGGATLLPRDEVIGDLVLPNIDGFRTRRDNPWRQPGLALQPLRNRVLSLAY